ncbi:MAG: xylulokinase [Planctomycetaceae bacterium]|jgi:xylulokinase|nr:xylulokinase [Planctomycetaceae bacterium]
MTFLGIDIGTSGTKTLAINAGGKILASGTQEYPCYAPKPLWSEQDPDDWWNAVIKTVRSVIKKAKLKPADVKAIGLSGQMHGSVFLDKNGKVIRKAILWNDQRTVAECREIETAAGGRENLIKLVANPALTGFTAPKILWLRNHEPKHYDKLRKVLLPKDEIRRRLTGEYATEVSDASGMLLLDVAKRTWSKELLSALKLDKDLLGKVYESEDVTGQLTPEAAKLLGLTTDCLVVGGAGDCAAGAIGNGIVGEGILSTSIGTSGVMFVYSDEVKIDPKGRVHTFCHAVRGKWHLMGVNLSSGGSLQWFRNAVCLELLSEAKKKKVDVYDWLTAEAEKTPAGSEGLYFLPYLSGERTPHADPFARGCFIGLTLVHKRGHLVRSVMEGVTYSMRDSLEIFQDLGIPVKQIRASGGGSKSPFWRQIQADVFGQRVVTINSGEGPALGVALLAAAGAGAFKDVQEACKAVIKVVKETKPNPKAAKVYDAGMPVYQDLYKSLKDVFVRIQ